MTGLKSLVEPASQPLRAHEEKPVAKRPEECICALKKRSRRPNDQGSLARAADAKQTPWSMSSNMSKPIRVPPVEIALLLGLHLF